MRVASFNLYNFAHPDHPYYIESNRYSDREWTLKLDWIREQLAEMRADLVGFQEVFSIGHLQALCAEAGYPHFAVVDSTAPDATGLFQKPVNAIASRLPVTVGTLPFLPAMALPLAAMQQALGISRPFDGYSRLPVVAEVETEDFGRVTVLVLHLKSKRPMVEAPSYPPDAALHAQVRDTMLHRSRGMIGSLLQRGAEAASVYDAVSAMLGESRRRPVVVLGDLNDEGNSVIMSALRKPGRFYEFNDKRDRPTVSAANGARWSYMLHDAWDEAGETGLRPGTIFHDGAPQVIDYILVSNAFGAPLRNRAAIGGVLAHEIRNDHLGPNKSTSQKRRTSDHAIVLAELAPRAAFAGTG